MNKKFALVILTALFIFALVGCSSATPTPLPLPTQPPQVITVVITATPPPATATPAQPTLTPVPTAVLTATVPAPSAATKAASSASASSKPAVVASRTPTKVAVPPTATNIPLKFGAINLNHPIWTADVKDEAQFDGGAIVFDWQSVGGLGGDECYLLKINTEPVNPGPGIGTAGDYWIINCGDQTPLGASVKFVLESPKRSGPQPNYDSIKIPNVNQMWANWSLSVVKNLGQCDASYPYHCKYAPLSPAGQGRFLFKGS